MKRNLIQALLDPIVRNYRRYYLWRALSCCWFVSALAAAALLVAQTQWGWRSPMTYPIVAAVAASAAILVLWGSLRKRIDYAFVARRIELSNPKLESLLLTAIEQQPANPDGELNYLQQRVVVEAFDQNRRGGWAQKTIERLFIIQAAHWTAFSLFLIMLAALQHPPAEADSTAWAPDLEIVPGNASVPRGDSLVILARFKSSTAPDAATLVVSRNDRVPEQIPLKKNLSDPVFATTLPPIQDGFTYRVVFSGHQSAPYKVEVFDYPELEKADAHLIYPEYTGLEQKTVEQTRHVSAVEGSQLTYRLALNKPVATAEFHSDKTEVVSLSRDPTAPNVMVATFQLGESSEFELRLTDEEGRTNRIPPRFTIDVLKNERPDLKLVHPNNDHRVSPIQEISFQGEAWDDFGLAEYGVGFSIGGGEPALVRLGQNAPAKEKQSLEHLLSLEQKGVQPKQLLTCFLWADDTGPSGDVRRTYSDIFFVEVRSFEEIFRESQMAGQSASMSGGPTAELAKIQKEIITATWNLQNRSRGSQLPPNFSEDAGVIQKSQEFVVLKLDELRQQAQSQKQAEIIDAAEGYLKRAASELGESAADKSVSPLSKALASEQAGFEQLLKLTPDETNIAQGQGSGQGGGQRSQQQLDQLELKQQEKRYETERQATAQKQNEKREELQILNRLKDLAQRQDDLNQRLKELQSALQMAQSDAEREEIQRRLKRLREEQQEIVADLDALQQKMARSQQKSELARSGEKLEETRSQLRQSAEQMSKEQVSEALASGTRAQRQLENLRDEVRKQTASQFEEEMREMRSKAREIAAEESKIAKQMQSLADAKHQSLRDSNERAQLAQELAQQKAKIQDLVEQMRDVTEQSEPSEPLLSRQLYESLRRHNQNALDEKLDHAAKLLEHGFIPQALASEAEASQQIQQLQSEIEQAAESILGNELESLQFAKSELDALAEQLQREIERAGQNGTNQSAQTASPGQANTQSAKLSRPQDSGDPAQGAAPSDAHDQRDTSSAGASRSPSSEGDPQKESDRSQLAQTSQPGAQERAGGQNSSSSQAGQGESSEANGPTVAQSNSGSGSARGSSRGGTDPGRRPAFYEGLSDRDGGGQSGPLTGGEYSNWAERLRDVEDLIENPDWRAELYRIRDRARAVRADFKRHAEAPEWELVQMEIAKPLADLRQWLDEELARRKSPTALVPIDRDPVPQRFSELVRQYYEELGRTQDQ